jgi:hypothetical protein
MRYLPFALTQGSELRWLRRAAAADPRRRTTCAVCGGAIALPPEPVNSTVRCPSCWRRQRICIVPEEPWRLSPDGAQALTQTRRWRRA